MTEQLALIPADEVSEPETAVPAQGPARPAGSRRRRPTEHRLSADGDALIAASEIADSAGLVAPAPDDDAIPKGETSTTMDGAGARQPSAHPADDMSSGERSDALVSAGHESDGIGEPSRRARYALVRRQPKVAAVPALDDTQRAVVEHRAGPLLVLAGPGTGKTTTLVEAVVARIEAGADPESILVLTFGRKAANELRERITARLARTTAEPLARTFHSYAFGLLRRVAAERGEPAPRLLTGPEQDEIIRDLLEGNAAGVDVGWPERLRPALRTTGFAKEVRNLFLRAAERGVGPAQLDAWGRRYGRDDWRAAARFMHSYMEITELRAAVSDAGTPYDNAQLIQSAVVALDRDPELLAAERSARAFVFVDEYQDADPAQEELLRLLCGGGRFLIVVGDPDQSIYAFRGTDSACIRRFPDTFPTVTREPAPTAALSTCRRSGPVLLSGSRRVAARLRGPAQHRKLTPAAGLPDGDIEVAVLRTVTSEAAFIAHRIRQAHLLDRVPWSRIAVIIRSPARHYAKLRWALIHAGVPVCTAGEDPPLASQPGVRPLLLALRCALRPAALDEDAAVALLSSPLGDADALGLRRLRQQLRLVAGTTGDTRPSGALLVEAINDPGALIPVETRWAAPARRVAAVIAATRQAAADPAATPESVLWALWECSGLGNRWQASSAAGGLRGAAADRDLDAVMALFDQASRYTDRMRTTGADMFRNFVERQQILADSLAPAAQPGEAVRILTAHAAKGLEWDVVAIAGVQEGLWPDLRPRGSLLGSEQLVDLAAAREPDRVGQLSALLDEERRLFYVAVTRARHRLVVTAVDGDEGDQPSRFLDELDPLPVDDDGAPQPRRPVDVPRTLSLGGLVAELRAVILDDSGDPARRRAAAAQLAELAAARIPGAAPAQWWGLAALSDARPLRGPGESVSISPSRVESFQDCALRWLLESAGGGTTSAAQGIGTVVHEVATAADRPVDLAALSARLAQRWKAVDLGGWYAVKQRERAEQMISKLAAWLTDNPRQLVAVEREFAVEVGRAVVRGRVDRLERDADGRLVVVDLKTGVGKPKDDEIGAHPQLGVYQLAVEHGGFAEQGTESGGAALVHIGTKTQRHSEQRQPALSTQDDPEWAERLVRSVAEGMAGAAFEAGFARWRPAARSRATR